MSVARAGASPFLIWRPGSPHPRSNSAHPGGHEQPFVSWGPGDGVAGRRPLQAAQVQHRLLVDVHIDVGGLGGPRGHLTLFCYPHGRGHLPGGKVGRFSQIPLELGTGGGPWSRNSLPGPFSRGEGCCGRAAPGTSPFISDLLCPLSSSYGLRVWIKQCLPPSPLPSLLPWRHRSPHSGSSLSLFLGLQAAGQNASPCCLLSFCCCSWAWGHPSAPQDLPLHQWPLSWLCGAW